MNEHTASNARALVPTSADSATVALAEYARVEAEGAIIMARRFPRELAHAQEALLADCSRPRFAENAWYRRPVGRRQDEVTGAWEDVYAEGFSIRFAEAAARHLGNIHTAAFPVYEDADQVRLRVIAIDLESNTKFGADFQVSKTIERKKPRKGQRVISERQTSTGGHVYVVEASPEELAVKVAAEVSKATRTLLMRLVPADIQEACEQRIHQTLTTEHEAKPQETVARLLSAFGQLRVSQVDLENYLGHPAAELSAEEREELLAVWTGIRDGLTTWAAVLAEKRGDVETEEAEAPAQASVTALKERLRVKANAPATKATPTAAPAPAAAPTSSPAEAPPAATTASAAAQPGAPPSAAPVSNPQPVPAPANPATASVERGPDLPRPDSVSLPAKECAPEKWYEINHPRTGRATTVQFRGSSRGQYRFESVVGEQFQLRAEDVVYRLTPPPPSSAATTQRQPS